MARSPHSRSDVDAALKARGIEGDWENLSYSTWRFEARNGAYFYFEGDDGIFFYGDPAGKKALVGAIWSYSPPKPKPWTKARLRKLQAGIARIKKENNL